MYHFLKTPVKSMVSAILLFTFFRNGAKMGQVLFSLIISSSPSLNLKMDSANTNISKKQDASTAITTSNIGSQSVNYANSSNYANSAGSANAATKAYKDGNGADIASTYLKGTQNNRDFINRPSVNIGGTICGLIPTYKQNSQGYPVVGLYIQPGTERLIIDWFADGNIIKSYIVTARS